MNILQILALAAAVRKIFQSRTEYTEQSFAELTDEQYAAWRRQTHQITGRVYRVIPPEPKGSVDGKLELTVVNETEKTDLIAATRLVYAYCDGSQETFTCFEDRLRFAARFLPDVLALDQLDELVNHDPP